MLPWFFAYDHTNYARFGTVYWSTLMTLSSSHPDAEAAFTSGEISVQRSERAFSQVAVDHAIEQTVNRDSKTPGGIIGMSTSIAATQRWLLTAHDRATLTTHCRDLAGVSDQLSAHKEAMPFRIRRDEADVQSLLSTMSTWINPFTDQEEVCCLLTGTQAATDVQEDLLAAERKGREACKAFISARLVEQSTPFYDPLPKMKLCTFKSMAVHKKVKTSKGLIQLRADRNLFTRLAIIAQT